MGKNREINQILRKGFGKAPSGTTASEERKQSGLRPPSKMTVGELVEETLVASERLTEVAEELALRAGDIEEEEEPGEGTARGSRTGGRGPTSQVVRGGTTGR